jgi:hypothetical protein
VAGRGTTPHIQKMRRSRRRKRRHAQRRQGWDRGNDPIPPREWRTAEKERRKATAKYSAQKSLVTRPPPAEGKPAAPHGDPASLHWLNTANGVRHNESAGGSKRRRKESFATQATARRARFAEDNLAVRCRRERESWIAILVRKCFAAASPAWQFLRRCSTLPSGT